MVIVYIIFVFIVIAGLYLFKFSKTRYNPKKPNLQKIQNTRPLHVVITGASKGVGYALAKKFLELGDYVIICSRSQQSVDQAVHRLRQETKNSNIYGKACDVTQYSSVAEFGDFVKSIFKSDVDLWLNNAGLLDPEKADLCDATPEGMKSVVDTNLLGGMYCYKVAYQLMQQNGGHIFFMEGNGSRGNTTPKSSVYGATKYALRLLTKTLALESKDSRIGCHRFQPGMVITGMLVGHEPLEPRLAKIFNILAEDPANVADFLVPRLRNTKGSNSYIPYLTTLGVMYRFLTAFSRRNRFFDNKTGAWIRTDLRDAYF